MEQVDEEQNKPHELTFWEHVETLRWVILRSLIAVAVCTLAVFANKDLLVKIIFAPQSSDFILYRAMCKAAQVFNFPALCPDTFSIEIINTQLTTAFFTHMSASIYMGLVLASPIVLFQLWRFVAPALYPRERKIGTMLFLAATTLFAIGVLLGYFLLFPITFRFLGTYDFGPVVKRIDLGSYLDTFYAILLSLGIVFEMPIVAYALSRIGIISKEFLRKYRRYAIVIILIIGAIITPTADPFTLMLVSIPMYGLYMLSIWVSKSKKATSAEMA